MPYIRHHPVYRMQYTIYKNKNSNSFKPRPVPFLLPFLLCLCLLAYKLPFSIYIKCYRREDPIFREMIYFYSNSKYHLLFDLSILKLLLKKVKGVICISHQGNATQNHKTPLGCPRMSKTPQNSLGWLESKNQITSVSENVKQSKTLIHYSQE